MRSELLIGTSIAILTGIVVATQTTFISRAGAVIGNTRVSLLVASVGAPVAILALSVIRVQGEVDWHWDRNTWIAIIIAGLLGMIVMAGFSFASQRAGITATLAAVFLGQMLISSLIDAQGWGGSGEIIPFTLVRFGGLILLGAGIYLLLFRQ